MPKKHITRERERALGKRWRDRRDTRARNELVEAHYGFVCSIVKMYSRSGAVLHDMIQNGVMGLMEAIDSYDPDRPTRLLTMAYWPIRRGILKAVKDASIFSSGVKSNRTEKVRYSLDGSVIPDEVRRIISLDVLCGDDDTESQTLGAVIPDNNTPDPLQVAEDSEILDIAAIATKGMKKREREIVKMRLGMRWKKRPGMSFREIGDHYGISAERVRKVFTKAIDKIKAHLGVEE